MKYWVFNEEQLERALVEIEDEHMVDLDSIRNFLNSDVVRLNKMILDSPEPGVPK